MKLNRIFTLSIAFVMLFGLMSATAPKSTSENSYISATNPQSKKVERATKFLNSKFGKWVIKQHQKSISKRSHKLNIKLAKAEKKGDAKKIERIKKKQQNLGKLGLWLIIGGLIGLVLGLIIAVGSPSAGGAIWVLGGLAILVGLILVLINLAQ